jgi:hypothetical protein
LAPPPSMMALPPCRAGSMVVLRSVRHCSRAAVAVISVC